MSRRALVALFVLALPVLLAATLPLRLLIDGSFDRLGLTASAISGPAWSGRLRTLAWRGHPLGDVTASLRPLSLLTGTRRLRLSAPTLSADIVQGRRAGFEHASGQLELAIRQPLPATVRFSLDNASLVFADGRCRRASGDLTAELIVEGLDRPLQLDGAMQCDGDRGSIALSARDPGLQVEATLAVDARGRYELRSRVRPVDGPLSPALQAAGFRPGPAGLSRVDSGSLANRVQRRDMIRDMTEIRLSLY